MSNESVNKEDQWRVGPGAYIALIFAIIFFSGVFYKQTEHKWLGALDFTTLSGSFGTVAYETPAPKKAHAPQPQNSESSIKKEATNSEQLTQTVANSAKSSEKTVAVEIKEETPKPVAFTGKGGSGARSGFLLALSLIPTVMLALGLLEIFSHYGAMRAAQKLMTPLLKPLLGLPGFTGLALITDLQSTDAGAALTRELSNEGMLTKNNLVVMSAWQYSGAGMINNYYSIGGAVFSSLLVPIFIPVLVMFVLKFVGGMMVRLVLNTVYKKDFQNE